MRKNGFAFLCLSCLVFFCCTLKDNNPPDDIKQILYGDKAAGSHTWTIMVYMAADNSLDEFALPDMNEMEFVSLVNEGVKVIVLCDRSDTHSYFNQNEKWQGTRLYEIKADNQISAIDSERLAADLGPSYPDFKLTATGDNEELNMGDPDTLTAFITWCRTHYSSDYYGLILWNHGFGWSSGGKPYSQAPSPTPLPTPTFGPTESPFPVIQPAICEDQNSRDMLTLKEVESAIISAVPPGQSLALVGMDACWMSLIETANQLSGEAEYLVASELLEPGIGWDYTEVLYGLIQLQDNTPAKVGRCMVDAYQKLAAKFAFSEALTLAAVNLNMMPAFMDNFNNFSQALIATNQELITTARNSTPILDDINDVDLSDFVSRFTYVDGANKLLDFLNNPDFLYFTQKNAAELHGLAIYFPFDSLQDPFNYQRYIMGADNPFISFSEVSYWDEFLTNYYQYLHSK